VTPYRDQVAQAVEVLPPPLATAAELNQVLDAANKTRSPPTLVSGSKWRWRLLRLLGRKSD